MPNNYILQLILTRVTVTLMQISFFYNQFSDVGCAYYLDDELTRMIENKSIENNFSLIHINGRSLSKNLDHLNIYLTSLSHMFSVIAVTETWANFTNESLLIIPGYNSIF